MTSDDLPSLNSLFRDDELQRGIDKSGVGIWDLDLATQQVESAGLMVMRSGSGETTMQFYDVGALAWYLKAVPWEVPSFSVAGCRNQLIKLHDFMQATGPIKVKMRYFWLHALKPVH